MPVSTPLDILPVWALCVLLACAVLVVHECGFRAGRFRGRHAAKESESSVGGIVGAELGLLALLLAFSFGIVASRFDLRRQVLLDEANAIGTTYLRTAMLDESQRGPVRRLLRDYVDVRLTAAGGTNVEGALRQSEQIHASLWNAAVTAAAQDPRSVPTGLFVQSLNELIDLHAKRVFASLRNRMPPAFWVALFSVALLSFLAMGYHEGLTRATRSPAVAVVTLTFVVVLWLIVDLDRPGEGFLRVSQAPMIDVRNMMDADP